MDVSSALATLVTVTSALGNLAVGAAQISAMIQKAQAEGRTEFTPEEWNVIQGADNAARSVLSDAIAKAKP